MQRAFNSSKVIVSTSVDLASGLGGASSTTRGAFVETRGTDTGRGTADCGGLGADAIAGREPETGAREAKGFRASGKPKHT